MAGTADMTAQEFLERYGRQERSPVVRRRSPADDRRLKTDDGCRSWRLEVDGVAVTLPEFVAAHARCCDCLTRPVVRRGGQR